MNFYDKCIKRIIDILLSGLAIIVLIPFWIVMAIVIKVDDPGPVFFTQKRFAKEGPNGEIRYFNILKYRTMKTSAPKDVPTHMFNNPEEYITRIGGFLRRTSIDELPQIFNIFAGHMSIIGPRPALYNQTDLYDERAKHGANSVRPGLTGWAQINGRDELEIDEKARYDGDYVKNLSFTMDLRCFFGSFLSVLRQDGFIEGGTGIEKDKEDEDDK